MSPTRALTPTARAILGFLSLHPRSGYEIRAAARRSAALVWGVNDGQLYPQLHDLHDRGLIGPGLVRSFGLDFVAMSLAWCDRALLEIDQTATISSGAEK